MIMPLPKIDVPTYELKIPSSGKEITIRPFLVKEEKLLFIAAASKDDHEIIKTTKQIINNCVVEGNVDVNTLPFFDIDYIFIALRAKSIGEAIEVKFNCNNITDEGITCDNKFSTKIDIANCSIVKTEGISNDIVLSGSLKIKMKYPSYSMMKAIDENDLNLEKKIKIIAHSIDQILDKDKVYTNKDFTQEELITYIEGLTQEQFKKLEVFVDNFPTFVINAEAKCNRCGYDHNIKYNDFSSFFF